MRCPSCGTDVEEGVWFCPMCAQQLEDGVAAPAVAADRTGDSTSDSTFVDEVSRTVAWADTPQITAEAVIVGEVSDVSAPAVIFHGAVPPADGVSPALRLYAAGDVRLDDPTLAPRRTSLLPPDDLTPYEQFVYEEVDGERTLGEIQSAGLLAPAEIQVSMLTLIERGLVSLTPLPPAAPLPTLDPSFLVEIEVTPVPPPVRVSAPAPALIADLDLPGLPAAAPPSPPPARTLASAPPEWSDELSSLAALAGPGPGRPRALAGLPDVILRPDDPSQRRSEAPLVRGPRPSQLPPAPVAVPRPRDPPSPWPPAPVSELPPSRPALRPSDPPPPARPALRPSDPPPPARPALRPSDPPPPARPPPRVSEPARAVPSGPAPRGLPPPARSIPRIAIPAATTGADRVRPGPPTPTATVTRSRVSDAPAAVRRMRDLPPPGAREVREAKARELYAAALVDRAHSNVVSARMNLKLAVALDPENAVYQEAFTQLGQVQLAPAASTDAISHPAAQKDFDDGCAAEAAGDVDRAIKLWEAALRHGEHPVIMNRLGVVLAMKRGDWRRGQTLLMRAVELAPMNAVYTHNLSKVVGMASQDAQAARGGFWKRLLKR